MVDTVAAEAVGGLTSGILLLVVIAAVTAVIVLAVRRAKGNKAGKDITAKKSCKNKVLITVAIVLVLAGVGAGIFVHQTTGSQALIGRWELNWIGSDFIPSWGEERVAWEFFPDGRLFENEVLYGTWSVQNDRLIINDRSYDFRIGRNNLLPSSLMIYEFDTRPEPENSWNWNRTWQFARIR